MTPSSGEEGWTAPVLAPWLPQGQCQRGCSNLDRAVARCSRQPETATQQTWCLFGAESVAGWPAGGSPVCGGRPPGCVGLQLAARGHDALDFRRTTCGLPNLESGWSVRGFRALWRWHLLDSLGWSRPASASDRDQKLPASNEFRGPKALVNLHGGRQPSPYKIREELPVIRKRSERQPQMGCEQLYFCRYRTAWGLYHGTYPTKGCCFQYS
jgi:hypothetical protein